MKIITSIFDKYPSLFRGQIPLVYTDIPEGWIKIAEGFCEKIISASSDIQLSEFFFEEISCSHGFLYLQYFLPASLPEDEVFAIGARAFAAKNRSYVGCVSCGTIIKTLPEKGEWPLCARHLRRKIAARKSGKVDLLRIPGLAGSKSSLGTDTSALCSGEATGPSEIQSCKI